MQSAYLQRRNILVFIFCCPFFLMLVPHLGKTAKLGTVWKLFSIGDLCDHTGFILIKAGQSLQRFTSLSTVNPQNYSTIRNPRIILPLGFKIRLAQNPHFRLVCGLFHRVLTPSPPSSKHRQGRWKSQEQVKYPLLPTGIGEWYSQTILSKCQAALLRRCQLPLSAKVLN